MVEKPIIVYRLRRCEDCDAETRIRCRLCDACRKKRRHEQDVRARRAAGMVPLDEYLARVQAAKATEEELRIKERERKRRMRAKASRQSAAARKARAANVPKVTVPRPPRQGPESEQPRPVDVSGLTVRRIPPAWAPEAEKLQHPEWQRWYAEQEAREAQHG